MPHHRALLRWGIVGMILLSILLLLLFAAPVLAFQDVPPGHAYETAINHLSMLKIVGGYANGFFGLNDPVKRAQFAKMVVGTLDITPPSSTATRFTDLGTPDANGYPHKFVQAAYDNGITTGTNVTQTLFAPWKFIRRDQVVTMIVRGVNSLYPGVLHNPPPGTPSLFDGVPEPHGQNLRIAEYNGLLDGLLGMGSSWSVTTTATRGEVAQMLWNLLVLLDGGGPPPPGDDVWVYANGTGDYPTIEAAVADIAPGTTIHLGPGVFTLTDTLYVDFPFNLVGSGSVGSSMTTVRYAGTVVDILDATFSAVDIRFVSTATTTASAVVYAEDADIFFDNCWITGGNRFNSLGGNGFYLLGNTTGTITDCVCTYNDMNGISVDEDADVSLEDNECRDNGSNGIGFWGASVGYLIGNTCENSAYNGIQGSEYAEVTAEDNWCRDNGSNGIALYDVSVGYVSGNTCEGNAGNGIQGDESAEVTAEDNECRDNGSNGIGFYGTSVGYLSDNTCEGNTGNGIQGTDYAEVTAEDNECRDNGSNGIGFFDSSFGDLSGNWCHLNYYCGIGATDDAEIVAEDNECSYNGTDGFDIWGYAYAVLIGNTCAYNTWDGIAVSEHAEADVVYNLCVNNNEAGIWFGDYSIGTASNNECAGNHWGIYVDATAWPIIYTSNYLHNNFINYYEE